MPTDNFNRADGSPGANWTANVGAAGDYLIDTNKIKAAHSGYGSMYYSGAAFANDQTSELLITATSGGYIGVACRVSAAANTWYGFILDGTNTERFKYVAGTGTSMGSSPTTVTAGDTLKIGAVGTDITYYKNGSAVASVTDSSIASGYAGIGGFGFASTGMGDDWAGLDVGGVGADLSANLSARATVTAVLTTAVPLAASLSARATVAAGITTAIPLTANLSARASVTAALTTAIPLSAPLTGRASLSAGMATSITMAATLSGRASLSATFDAQAADFSATLQARATQTAALTTSIPLAAQLTGRATVSADLATAISFAAQLTASARVQADMSGVIFNTLAAPHTEARIINTATRAIFAKSNNAARIRPAHNSMRIEHG